MQGEIHIETADTGSASFLQMYVQNNMAQQVRLENTISEYESLLNIVKQRILDESDLVDAWTQEVQSGTGIATPDMLETAKGRLEDDMNLRDEIQRILDKLKSRRAELSQRVRTYLMELSQSEIDSGGFVAHTFGYTRDVDWDAEHKILYFNAQGARAEAAIALPLHNWKDSSQFTLVLKNNNS